MTKKEFIDRCQTIARELDLGEVLFFKDSRGSREVEDDGALHVVRRGVRACFDVRRYAPAKQNSLTRSILDVLGIEPNESVWTEETDFCPHCGEPI